MSSCNNCGKSLEGMRSDARYCSRTCRVKACYKRKPYVKVDIEKLRAILIDLDYLARRVDKEHRDSNDSGNLVADKYIGLRYRSDEEVYKVLGLISTPKNKKIKQPST